MNQADFDKAFAKVFQEKDFDVQAEKGLLLVEEFFGIDFEKEAEACGNKEAAEEMAELRKKYGK